MSYDILNPLFTALGLSFVQEGQDLVRSYAISVSVGNWDNAIVSSSVRIVQA